MPIVTLFSASYCHGDEVAERVAARLGYRVLSLDELLAECSGRHGVHADKVKKIMLKPSSVFNRWTREKERNIAVLRSTLAEMIQDEMVHHGFAGLLMYRLIITGLSVPVSFAKCTAQAVIRPRLRWQEPATMGD